MINPSGLVFLGCRSDMPEAWQMPQGGIDAGEDARTAALRELEEETGTNKVEVLAEHADWLSYDFDPELQRRVWGGRYLGQRQKWFAMRFTGVDADIDIATHHPEFDEWRWGHVDELVEVAVPFKRETYATVAQAFRHLTEN
jgi:putative (di)nucleoside polyphosphate hydrolase